MTAPAPETPMLSLVVPAYNEAANITPVVHEILSVLAASTWVDGYEVILVDDGSSDGTGAVMDALAREHPELTAVHHPRNRGFGAALRTGFTHTRGRVVSLMSADGELGVDQILNLLRDFGDDDLVLSRRERTVGVERRFLTWGFDLLVRVILGFWIDKDVGIYLVRGDLVRSLTLVSDTGLANLELILHCRQQGRRVTRGGVTRFRQRLSGQSKVANVSTVARTLWEMVKLRWRLVMRRQYNRAAD